MAFTSGSAGGPNADINVTPLVDVVLVLLIIFMVVTPLLQVNMDADIPKPIEDVENVEQPKEQVVISILANGDIMLNSTKVTEERLAAELRTIMAKRADKIAFLSGTDNLEFGRIVHVMDVAKGAGVSKIGIIDPL